MLKMRLSLWASVAFKLEDISLPAQAHIYCQSTNAFHWDALIASKHVLVQSMLESVMMKDGCYYFLNCVPLGYSLGKQCVFVKTKLNALLNATRKCT